MRGTPYGWWCLGLVGLAFLATISGAYPLGIPLGIAAIVVGGVGISKHGTTYHILIGIILAVLVIALDLLLVEAVSQMEQF
jgi:membrane protein implicated in regulation of membrane protease activity